MRADHVWTSPTRQHAGPVSLPSQPTVIVVGGKLKIVQKAHALGLDVVYLQSAAAFSEAHKPFVQTAFLIDFTDVELAVALARVAASRSPIGHAVSLTEDGLTVVGAINDSLGLPGTGAEVARRIKDKLIMRRHLADTAAAAYNVAAEPFRGAAELVAFGSRHGWPLIVKPSDLSASVGVQKVTGPDEAAAVSHQVRAWQTATEAPFDRVRQFMVEAFVPGPEVSVEAFSSDGRHVVLAVTEKVLAPGSAVEMGHALPARLNPETEQAVRAATISVLDAIGLRDGPSHTEFRLGWDQPQLIETHNRVGGDRIHDLVEAACGVDQDRLWLSGPLGRLPPLSERPPVRQAAATRFFQADPGQVIAIEGVDEVSAHPDVIGFELTAAIGDRIGPLRTSWDRVGQVVVTAPTTAAAVCLAQELAARVRVVTR